MKTFSKLTPASVSAMQRLKLLEEEVKQLKQAVKPVLDDTPAGEYKIAGKTVQITESTRNSVSWATVAKDMLTPQQMRTAKAEYSRMSVSKGFKLV